jgi:hypothetical protein
MLVRQLEMLEKEQEPQLVQEKGASDESENVQLEAEKATSKRCQRMWMLTLATS